MIVYYNGIKYFDYTNGEFNLNKSVFIPNNTNRKNLKYNEIPTAVKNDVNEIGKLNFEFTVGANVKNKNNVKKFDVPFNSNGKSNASIIRELEQEIKKFYPNLQVKEEKNKKYIFLIEETKNKTIKFNNLYNLLLTGYEKCPSIDFHVNLINSDISKLTSDFDNSFNKLDEVMKRRINIYCSESKEHRNDYNRTKTDNNTEKQYRQKLMNIVSGEKFKINTELCKKIFDGNEVIPFEMEYNMYSKEKEKKTQTTPKGRIDNLFVKGDTLVIVELKMGTSVIGGTNGIHKHLLDLCTIFENNKKILDEISDVINERDKILNNYESTKKYSIEKNNDVELKGKKYYIICGYDENKGIKKEMVKCEIDRLYYQTIKSVEILKKMETYKKLKLTKDSKTVKDFHKTLEKYPSNFLKLTIPEYIKKLDDYYKCEVKIILANQDYTIIEPYKYDK